MEFTIKGVKIRFSYLFFFLFTLLFLFDRSGFVLMGMLAGLIHELGHMIAFLICHDLPQEISFELTGIRLVRKKGITTRKKEVFELLMGSGINFFLFFVCSFSLDRISPVSIFAVSHLVLGIFNLLPIEALDGGKLFQLMLESRTDPQNAYIWTKRASRLILILLISGLLLRLGFDHSKSNVSLLLLAVWMIAVGLKPKTA